MWVVLVFGFSFIVYSFLEYLKMLKYNKTFTGKQPLPIIGNLHQFAGSATEFFINLNSYWEEFGTRFCGFVGNKLFIFMSDPKEVEMILSTAKYIEKSDDYTFFKPWLGDGLLISKGEKWRQHRKVITPTFHFKILEQFVQIFDSQGDGLIKNLMTYVDQKDSFDLFEPIRLYTLDLIGDAAMGVNINSQNNSNCEYVMCVREMCRIIVDRGRNPLKRNDLFFYLSRDYWKQRKCLKYIHGFTNAILKERRMKLKDNQESLSTYTNLDNQDFGTKKKMAFLDMLLLSTLDGKPMSDTAIRNEVDTFLFEGHDTSTSAISFALYAIAHNPEIQKKIFDEQFEIFGSDYNKPITHDDLQKMKYLELCVKESIRLYPSIPMVARKVLEKITIDGKEIPAGCTVLVLLYNMNRNPDVFRDPLKFIPERFLPEESNKRHAYSTVSFGAGPRNCIGQKFAMLVVKTTLSKVLRRYEVLPSHEPLKLTGDITLKSENGVKIKLTKRKY